MRSNAVTVWNGASAGTLNLVVLRMGASPVCLKLTITFPSLTAEADDDMLFARSATREKLQVLSCKSTTLHAPPRPSFLVAATHRADRPVV